MSAIQSVAEVATGAFLGVVVMIRLYGKPRVSILPAPYRISSRGKMEVVGLDAEAQAAASAAIEAAKPKEYPVAGRPRHVPWAQRRRALEAQHRTKRKALEEWE